MKQEILLKIKRSNLIEKKHYGFITVVNDDGSISSQIGDSINSSFFIRSCMKPFQALPILTSGAFKKFNLDLRELAVSAASHTASFEHVETVKSILNKINLSQNHLQCGIHEPIDIKTRNHLIKNDLKPSPIHNNCSGKHAGMLAVCVHNKWNLKKYLDINHPLQKEILQILKDYCELKGKIENSVDGCSTPIYGMPLHKLGLGLLKLFLSKEGQPLKKAFKDNPVLIGGEKRLDTTIIKASKGNLVSKIGADGLCVVINPDVKQALVVKVYDSSQTARSVVTLETLKQLNWLSKKECEHDDFKSLDNLTVKDLKNTAVGEIVPTFNLK